MRTLGAFPIYQLGDGWYDFSALNQEGRYIKIHTLRCLTDRKAMNQARKIAPEACFEFRPGAEKGAQSVPAAI